jgi:hypothetical protein
MQPRVVSWIWYISTRLQGVTSQEAVTFIFYRRKNHKSQISAKECMEGTRWVATVLSCSITIYLQALILDLVYVIRVLEKRGERNKAIKAEQSLQLHCGLEGRSCTNNPGPRYNSYLS